MRVGWQRWRKLKPRLARWNSVHNQLTVLSTRSRVAPGSIFGHFTPFLPCEYVLVFTFKFREFERKKIRRSMRRIKKENSPKRTLDSRHRCHHECIERFTSRINPKMVKRRNFRPISEKLNWRGEEGREGRGRQHEEGQKQKKNCQNRDQPAGQPAKSESHVFPRIHAIFYYFCGYTRVEFEKILRDPRHKYTLHNEHTHIYTRTYIKCNRSSHPTAFSRRARSAPSALQTPWEELLPPSWGNNSKRPRCRFKNKPRE